MQEYPFSWRTGNIKHAPKHTVQQDVEPTTALAWFRRFIAYTLSGRYNFTGGERK